MSRLSKEDLGDSSRFQFKTHEVELEELGGSVLVRTPTVEQQSKLADLVDGEKFKGDVASARAKALSIAVVEPTITEEEAKRYISEWPASAVEKIESAFQKLMGTEQEESAAADQFRGSD